MKVTQIVKALEAIAPARLAAEWDNVGLLVGDDQSEAGKLLLCIDLTEVVLSEAKRIGAQMVMAYHPVIFKAVSRVTASEAPVAYAAARAGIAVYSAHTALDAAPGGTNDVLADVLGMTARRPLDQIVRSDECKVVVFVPPEDLARVAEAAFACGAGRIGKYFDCAFFAHGIGAFCGGPGTHPAVGHIGRHEAADELRFETVVPKSQAAAVRSAIRAVHSYEEPVVDIYALEDYPQDCGLGRIGRLPRAVTPRTLIGRIKKATGLKKVLLSASRDPLGAGRKGAGRKSPKITTAACCAGSCGDLWRLAAKAGAQFYLTGEMRHHDALAASSAGMTVVCLGHSNSERIALSSLRSRLKETLPKLNVQVSKLDADPFEIT